MTITDLNKTSTPSTDALVERFRDQRGQHIAAASMFEGCLSSHNRVLCSKQVPGLTLERTSDTTGRMVSTTNPTLWTPEAALDLIQRNPDLTAMLARDWHREQIEQLNAAIRHLRQTVACPL